MSDAKLVEEFVRMEIQGERIKILIREVSWRGPYRAVSTWTLTKELPLGSSGEEVDAVVQGLLRDRRYFRVCTECSLRVPNGRMHDGKLCQGCAQQVLGVVY